jgi:phosphopantothenoylcysteine decarboxylase/phosphopantothenoylcysteine decarboxylase/phosphopantothenate--cysteine ligase
MQTDSMAKPVKQILLGVTGSIAAYKACDIASGLVKKGYEVQVVMTEGARQFVTPITFQTLTHRRVYYDMFNEYDANDVRHISLARACDGVLVAPASANIIGKIANGIADDTLSTVIMAVKDKPILIAPAMNTAMYENPILQENISKLKRCGYMFIEPKEGLLACGDVGKGALAEVSNILETVKKVL